ncbi:MAG: rhomboid family intramembrane serine protease [Verrucomicrobiales bacterium]
MVYCPVLWKSQRYTYRESFTMLFAWVVVLFIIEAIDQLLFHNNLFVFGVVRGDFEHWYRIFFAPFLHEDFLHVASNSAGLLVLGSIVLLLGADVLATVTFAAIVISGFGLLFFGSEGVHSGASSVVYGYFGFLVVRGLYERSWKALALSGGTLILFQSLLSGMLPGVPGLSWQGHVLGALGGVVAASTLARERRKGELAFAGIHRPDHS